MKAEDLIKKKITHPELTPVKAVEDNNKRYTLDEQLEYESMENEDMGIMPASGLKFAKLRKRARRHNAMRQIPPESLIPKKRKMKQYLNMTKFQAECAEAQKNIVNNMHGNMSKPRQQI